MIRCNQYRFETWINIQLFLDRPLPSMIHLAVRPISESTSRSRFDIKYNPAFAASSHPGAYQNQNRALDRWVSIGIRCRIESINARSISAVTMLGVSTNPAEDSGSSTASSSVGYPPASRITLPQGSTICLRACVRQHRLRGGHKEIRVIGE